MSGRFGAWMRLPVRRPFRLDLTVDALRRLAANAVDVAGSDGTYYRAVRDECGAALLAVRAGSAGSIEVRASRARRRTLAADRSAACSERTPISATGTRAVRRFRGSRELARLLRGLKPPRYPTLWEACAHAIVFQQISIHAGAAIMRRLVETLAEEVVAGGIRGRHLSRARSAGSTQARRRCERRDSRRTNSRTCARPRPPLRTAR